MEGHALLMVSDAERVTVLEEGELPRLLAVEYLKLYLGLSDWSRHLGALWTRLSKGASSEEAARAAVRKAFALAILLPIRDSSVRIDGERPENLLHTAMLWRQAGERDWWKDFQAVVAQDRKIDGWREQVCAIGYIDPIDCAPYTRQAFNWLWEQAEKSGVVTPETKEEISRRHENMVRAYGGACISNMFLRHEDKLRKVHNYRTGYFVERVIYEVYTVDQVLRIKQAELDKTNPQLVKRFQ
jgi:hypothetical protein